MSKRYLRIDVLTAAVERMRWVFDTFEHVWVSTSGGKDSTVLLELARREALSRGRTVTAFFLDQEAEYQATVDVLRIQMAQPGIIPSWHQVPMRMTNATSLDEEFLRAWWPGEEWIRPQEPGSVKALPGAPDRFYDFFPWHEAQLPASTVCLVGLRGEEHGRFNAVTRHAAVAGKGWTTRGGGTTIRAYPLYDWTVEDIWTFIGNEGLAYNRIYDLLWAKGGAYGSYRVSNLIHETAYKSLCDLQEFEPETYAALVKRLAGVHTAALYGREALVYNARKLPAAFATWEAYRDHLLAQTSEARRPRFAARFASQPQTEAVFRQQCRQLQVNDFENSTSSVKDVARPDPLAKWRNIL